MAPTLTVDGYDLSSYVAWAERSADITDPARLTPQFGGNTAFNDGQPWSRTSAADKTWQVPLLLNAASTDALHTLVQTVNSHLFKGAQVAFKPQGATNTTYFDLEAGRLDPHWDLYIDTAGYLQATLNLWTRPYGHTGTTLLIASTVGTGVVQIAASIGGEIEALGVLEAQMPSYTTGVPVVAYGLARSASYQALAPVASLTVTNGAVIGASGAVGSQYIGVPTNSSITRQLTPVGAYLGERVRVFAPIQHRVFPATEVNFQLSLLYAGNGFITTASVGVGGAASSWKLVDLGELTLPAIGSAVPSDIAIYTSVWIPATASVVASPAVRMGGLICIPVTRSAGVAKPNPLQNPSKIFRWEGIAQEQGYFGTATTLDSPVDAVYRLGGAPRITAADASGPVQFCALVVGNLSDMRGNDPFGVRLYARPRFSYLR